MAKKKRLNSRLSIFLVILGMVALSLLAARFEKPRFTEDSLDNPKTENHNKNNQPTLLESSSDIGVILVHGLAATPFETKELAEYLHSRNITTYQVLLAGL